MSFCHSHLAKAKEQRGGYSGTRGCPYPLLCGGRTSLLDLESWSSWEMPRSSDSPDSSLMKLEGNIPVFPLRTPSHHPSSTCTHVNRRTEAGLRLDMVFPSFLSPLYRAKCKAHAGRAAGPKASRGTGNETADLTEPRDSGTGRGFNPGTVNASGKELTLYFQ